MPAFAPIKIPPGFFRNGTEYESAGRYYDGNLVRWSKGRIRPWGGWKDTGGVTLSGIARAIINWRANNGFRYSAIGTNTKLYISNGGNYADLTPGDLVAGRADSIEGPGYGAAAYGAAAYGTRRTSTGITLDASTWTFDTWGEDLLAVSSADGRLLEYSVSAGTVAAVSGAPTMNAAVLVTDEEHVMLLGAGGNKRRVAWCSQGDDTIWTAADTNTAGGENLKTQGNIVTGARIASTPYVWTTEDFHALTYIGPPLIYRTDRIAENCGIISANAKATDTNSAYWMGLNGFFAYDGVVRPLPCDVQDYVFSDLNALQRAKIFAGRNSQDGEIIWFYCSAASDEIDRYVVYNYFYKIWYFGSLARTCWADRGTFVNPRAVAPDGTIYDHEFGYLADGASRNADIFVQSGPAEIGNGDKVIYATLMVPDVDVGTADALQVRFKMKTAPLGREFNAGPYGLTPNSEGYVPVRAAGRQAALRYEQIADKGWSIGTQRFVIGPGGGR